MQDNPETMKHDSADDKPLLPDGIGLSISDVQKLLAEKHEIAIPKDDPVLMVVTMLNAYLKEVQTLHERHEKGMSKLLADKTDVYVSGIQDSTNKLTETFTSASTEGVKQVWAENMIALVGFRKSLALGGTIIFLSALVNVTVFILLGLR